MFSAGLILYFLLKLNRKNIAVLYFLGVLPVSSIILTLIHVDFFISILFLAYVYRVLVKTFPNPLYTDLSHMMVNALGFALVSLLIGILANYPYEPILYLLIIQFFIFMIGHFISLWIQGKQFGDGRDKKAILIQFFSLVTGVTLVTMALTLVVPEIWKWIGNVLYWLIYGIFSLFGGVFEGIHSLFVKGVTRSEEEFAEFDGTAMGEMESTMLEPQTDVNFLPLYIISLLLITYFVYKMIKTKRGKEVERKKQGHYIIEHPSPNLKTRSLRKRKRQKVSNIPIRKAMYELEMTAKKLNKGRNQGETIQQWLQRNNIHDVRLVEMYEKVRYGDYSATAEENNLFKHLTRQIQREWKKDFERV